MLDLHSAECDIWMVNWRCGRNWSRHVFFKALAVNFDRGTEKDHWNAEFGPTSELRFQPDTFRSNGIETYSAVTVGFCSCHIFFVVHLALLFIYSALIRLFVYVIFSQFLFSLYPCSLTTIGIFIYVDVSFVHKKFTPQAYLTDKINRLQWPTIYLMFVGSNVYKLTAVGYNYPKGVYKDKKQQKFTKEIKTEGVLTYSFPND